MDRRETSAFDGHYIGTRPAGQTFRHGTAAGVPDAQEQDAHFGCIRIRGVGFRKNRSFGEGRLRRTLGRARRNSFLSIPFDLIEKHFVNAGIAS